jgi:hypothetical protein
MKLTCQYRGYGNLLPQKKGMTAIAGITFGLPGVIPTVTQGMRVYYGQETLGKLGIERPL